uniref:Uncharacterized protein n=1 Tax=Arundo donax TaxID=35708 RepID=A0A0A9CG32_ARUDO
MTGDAKDVGRQGEAEAGKVGALGN